MEAEVEDDAFFADLSKQIALLIMDEEEEEEEFELGFPLQRPHLLHRHHQQQQGFLLLPLVPQVMVPPAAPPPPYVLEMPFPRESIACKGTGVFIPRSSDAPAARRKNKSRRSTVHPSMDGGRKHSKEPLRRATNGNPS